METLVQRSVRESDLPILRLGLSEGAWRNLARLLESACTKPDWILLSFEKGVLADVLALVAPSEFNLPLEIVRLHRGLDARIDSFRLFQRAIEKAKALGISQLYCTVPEYSADAAVLAHAGFCRWRKVVRFESAGPVNLEVQDYRSAEVANFARSEIIALIGNTSEGCRDSQIVFYRQRLGPLADAEMTLQMMESARYESRWWRVALSPDSKTVGIILLVVAFGEPAIGYIGIVPDHRGRNIASYLITESWSLMKQQGHSTLSAEADERSVSMHRALTKSQFNRLWQKQEWRLDL
jgi:GNAT superfamily N-acetyltransferase